ncbi:MAG: heavy-metal-associated domain-containing protein [Bacteroidales bacterium]
MKHIKAVLFATLFLVSCAYLYAEKLKENEAVITLQSSKIDCHSCKAKIEKNIPFEKGVSDLNVDIKLKTVTIKYRTDKTTIEALQKSLEKIGYPTEVVSATGITH